jgi:hypothetical protein
MVELSSPSKQTGLQAEAYFLKSEISQVLISENQKMAVDLGDRCAA